MSKKWVSFLMIMIMMMMMVSVSVGANEKQTDEELEKIEKKIAQNKSKIKQKNREKKIAEQELGELSQELRYTKYTLQKTQKNLTITQKKVSKTESELQDTKSRFQERNSQFKKRVVDIFKNKNLGFLEFVFAPVDLVSMVESSYYFDRLIKNDTDMIQGMKQDYNYLERETQKLKTQKEKLAEINQEISQKERLLGAKRVQQQRYVQNLKSEISEMERKNRELEESSREITSEIMSLVKGKGYLGTGRFIRPTHGWVSSLFGYRRHPIFKRRIFHNGVDFAGPTGQPIKAADGGVVIVAGQPPRYRGYGNITIIDHGTNKEGKRVSTIYAHQSRIGVNVGDTVKQGEVIGYIGSTGYATGPHLHFEVRVNGVPDNPLRYMKL